MGDIAWDTLWNFHLPGEREVSARAPVVCNGVVHQVFTYRKKSFYESVILAFEQQSGQERWRRIIEHVATEPVVAPDGTLYVASFAGSIHAYGPAGETLWTSACSETNLGKPCLAAGRIHVAEAGGRARRTHGLDAATGAVLWSYENGGHSYAIAATPDVVVHATSRGRFDETRIQLNAIAGGTGTLLWAVESDQYLFQPTIADGRILIGARGALRAYRLSDGQLEASLPLSQPVAASIGPIPYGDGFVFADDSGTVRRAAFRTSRRLLQSVTTLEERWSWSFPDEIAGPPVDLGAHVGVLVKRGTLHLLDAGSGAVQGSLVVGDGESTAGGIDGTANALAVAHGRTLKLIQIDQKA